MSCYQTMYSVQYIVLIIDNQQQMLRFITYLKGTGTVTVPEICLFG